MAGWLLFSLVVVVLEQPPATSEFSSVVKLVGIAQFVDSTAASSSGADSVVFEGFFMALLNNTLFFYFSFLNFDRNISCICCIYWAS